MLLPRSSGDPEASSVPEPEILDARSLPRDAAAVGVFSERARAIEQRIRALDSTLQECPHRSYGLEIRLAGAILHGSIPREQLVLDGHPRAGTGPRPLRRLLLRPSPEPIVHSYWESLGGSRQPIERISRLASCLYSDERRLRTTSATTARTPADPLRFRYPEAQAVVGALERRAERERGEGVSALQWAFCRFVDFNVAHPFTDGNGRTARALLVLDLAGSLGLRTPCLPLAPIAYLSSPAFCHYYRVLGVEGAWHEFYRLFLDLVEAAAVVAPRLV